MHGNGLTADAPADALRHSAHIRLFEDGAFRDFGWRPRFGPEVGCAAAWTRARPGESLVCCKFARDASNLYYDWHPEATVGGSEDEFRGPLYPRLLHQWRLLRETLLEAGEQPVLSAFCWMQGERDSVFRFMAENYQQSLSALIRHIRADTAAPELPVVIGRVAPRVIDPATGESRHPFHALVHEAQTRIARELPGISLVETADLPQSDNLHFTAAGQIELGRRFALAASSFLPALTP